MKPDLKAIMGGASAPAASDSMGEGKGAADPMADDKQQSDDPLVQAAGLVREAITAGDDEALADALKSFNGLHSTAAPMAASKPKLIGSKT